MAQLGMDFNIYPKEFFFLTIATNATGYLNLWQRKLCTCSKESLSIKGAL